MDPIARSRFKNLQSVLNRDVRAFIAALPPSHRRDRGVELEPESVRQLTQALLLALSEVSLEKLGCDPISRFDTEIALVPTQIPAARALCSENLIFVTIGLCQSIEFIGAHAVLSMYQQRLVGKLASGSAPSGDGKLTEGWSETLYGLLQARLLLFHIDAVPLPKIASRLAEADKPFVHQLALVSLLFILLHEQAHIEFGRNPEIMTLPSSVTSELAVELDSDSKIEEIAADLWALGQVPASSRSLVARAAIYFLIEHWTRHYALHDDSGDHPVDVVRMRALFLAYPEIEDSDPNIRVVLSRSIAPLVDLRRRMTDKDLTARYSSMLRFCRSVGEYRRLEELADAFREAVEQGEI